MVIILNGIAASGKGEVYGFMNQKLPGIKYSWVEYARTMLRDNYIDISDKSESVRRMLAGVNQALEELDIPFKDVISVINDVENGYFEESNIYIDIRNPKDIKRTVHYCTENEIPVQTIYVERKNNKCPDNPADISALEAYEYDFYIKNEGTLADLKKKSQEVVKIIEG